MAIYVFNDPKQDAKDFVSKSLNQGFSRFGWSWFDSADLKILENMSWEEMNEHEIETWNKCHFLLNIKKGDWIIHVNVPEWGFCIAAQVEQEYDFEKEDTEISDFRHYFQIDKDALIKFNRNDDAIHPIISRKLKLRGRYWRIYNEVEFIESINNLKNGHNLDGKTKEIAYLKKEIQPLLLEFTNKIHRTHPEKKLEKLICELLKNVPNVTDVYMNGSGYKSDYGADIIVKYSSGLSFLNLQKEETLVVQVKSYENIHWETNAVSQIETAINTFKADCGLIITTAQNSPILEKAVEDLSLKLNKPVRLIAGEDVAKFLLKFEQGILIDF